MRDNPELAHLADLATAHGARFSGGGVDWALIHPATGAEIRLRLDADEPGDVRLEFDGPRPDLGRRVVYLDAAMVADPEVAELYDVVSSILEGRMRQYVAYDQAGQVAAYGWQVQLAGGRISGDHNVAGLPVEESARTAVRGTWRYAWTECPAWEAPPSGRPTLT
jgi:hypothetical protein